MVFAQGQLQQIPNDPAVKKGTLENGLTYYIRHNENPKGRAEFYLATNVGAIQETPDQDGLAHFLEHMCFNGTKNFPDKSLLDYLQSIGASFGGNVNASTGVERTIYMLNNIPLVREGVVDSCILIMHDYSHFVTNDPAEIDKERPVIIEERRSRRNASWRMHEKTLNYYYGDSKYSNCTIIGSLENLQTFKPESLVNFYETWCRPDLQALIVVGDVNVDEVEQKIKTIFADIPAPVNPKAKDYIKIPDNKEPVVGIITDPEALQTSIEILWKSEAAPKALNSTVQGKLTNLVKDIIGTIMDERCADIVAKPDAPFTSANLGIGKLCESMEVVMGNVYCNEGKSIPAFKAFLTEIEKMKRYGFSEAEIERAKTNILSSYETAAKKAQTRKNSELVYELIYNFTDNYAYQDPNDEYELVKQLMSVLNSQVINAVTAQLITDENMVVVYKAPEKEGVSHPTESELTSLISEVKSSDIQANAAEESVKDLLDASQLKGSSIKKTSAGIHGSTVWQLKNGLKIVLYPSSIEKDRIYFRLEKDGGQSIIPAEDLASFQEFSFDSFLSNSGVSQFSGTELPKMLAGKNIAVKPFVSSLRHGVYGSSTIKDLETSFQLMYLYYTDPRFDQNEFDQTINKTKAILPNLVNLPNYRAQQELYSSWYGDNPRVVLVSPETVEKASIQTIEKNYRRLFSDIAGAKVVIAGDFDIEEIKPLVLKYFGSLPKGKKATDWIDPQVDILPGKRTNDFSVDMQTPMSTVYYTWSADTEYSIKKDIALSAASYILDMKYTKSLREDEGGTYGASSIARLAREPKGKASIIVAFNTKPEQADKLREIAASELNALGENGPSAEEFSMAKKNLEKNIPEKRTRCNYWLDILLQHERFGGDKDAEYEAAVNALTAEDVRSIVKEITASGNLVEMIMRPGKTTENE